MNVYDVAHQLAKAVAESDEYRAFLAEMKKLEANQTAADMFFDFRRRELELQAAQMMGQQPAEEKLSQLRRLAEIISMHPDIVAFTAAEYRFDQLMADIQRIQSEAVTDWLEFANKVTARAMEAAGPGTEKSRDADGPPSPGEPPSPDQTAE
ncbi:MAG TPA: YlbF family regulator [Bacillota bacterium]|jgi:cell fate (sporulation/competence/biofilm development) regulator YlbF (YheA/YmcA/DUF963 family)